MSSPRKRLLRALKARGESYRRAGWEKPPETITRYGAEEIRVSDIEAILAENERWRKQHLAVRELIRQYVPDSVGRSAQSAISWFARECKSLNIRFAAAQAQQVDDLAKAIGERNAYRSALQTCARAVIGQERMPEDPDGLQGLVCRALARSRDLEDNMRELLEQIS